MCIGTGLPFLFDARLWAQSQPACLTGYLHNAAGNRFELHVADPVFPFKHETPVDANGRFRTVFLLTDTTEISLVFNNTSIPFFLAPGDSVELDLDADAFEPTGVFLRTAGISGRLHTVNRLVFDHLFALQHLQNETTGPTFADPNQSPGVYKAMRFDELEACLEAWEGYVEEHALHDPLFKRWAEATLRYRAGEDILFFPFAPGVRHGLSDTSAYFRMAPEVPLNDLEGRYLFSRHRFLTAYTGAFERLVQTAPYINRRQLLRDWGYPVPMIVNQLVLECLLDLPPGDGQTLLLVRFYTAQLAAQGALTQFQQKVLNEAMPMAFRRLIAARFPGKTNWDQRITDWTTDENLRAELRNLTGVLTGPKKPLCFVTDRCAADAAHSAGDAHLVRYEILSPGAAAFWETYAGIRSFPWWLQPDEKQ